MQRIRTADFIAFDEVFLDLVGGNAKVEMVQAFEGDDAEHVHEAPVYLPSTGELLYADTSVVGWLWALDVKTHTVRAASSLRLHHRTARDLAHTFLRTRLERSEPILHFLT